MAPHAGQLLRVLGLAFGLALAFIAYYLDPRLRDRADAEAIGLNIIAEIPKK